VISLLVAEYFCAITVTFEQDLYVWLGSVSSGWDSCTIQQILWSTTVLFPPLNI